MDNLINNTTRKNAERFQCFVISSCIGMAVILYSVMSSIFSEILAVIYNSISYESYKLLVNSSIYNNCVYIIYAALCVVLPFLCAHLLIRKFIGHSTRLPFTRPKKGSGFAPAICIGLGLCVIGNYLTVIFTLITEGLFSSKPTGAPSDVTSASQISFVGFLVSVLATAVVASLVEEFAIRGVVMQPLRRFGDKFAIVISALVFSAIHGNFQQIPFAFVVGLALGYVVIRTGSIWAGVLLHFINNLWSVCAEYLSYLVPEMTYVIVYYIVNVVFCTLAIISAIVLYKRDVKAGMTSGVLKKPECEISVFGKTFFVISAPTFLFGIGYLVYEALQKFVAV